MRALGASSATFRDIVRACERVTQSLASPAIEEATIDTSC